MIVLVTGGAGYIGSHACLSLLEAGHEVVVVDNLSNSKEESLHRVEKLTGKSLIFHQIDLLDAEALDQVIEESKPDAVIHFAGYKAVGESVEKPMMYWHNNITGTINLLQSMQKHGVKVIVFSSSATVYGEPEKVPITEEFPLKPYSPYGWTKFTIEQMLRDQFMAHHDMSIALLRYFNPVGAHQSGMIGEDPNGIPNNLFPFISQVLVGRRPELRVFGNDYPTPDGTGVRDYIHVMDLVDGHVVALEKLHGKPGLYTYNLGTGTGCSVLDTLHAFEKVTGREIPYKIVDRRPGDVTTCYADCSKATEELGWKAKHNLEEMCADSWRWQSQNPNGYL